MCDDHSPPAGTPAVWHEAGPVQRIGLEPVDSVEITTIMDNVTDLFMPDQGLARRPGPGIGPTLPCGVMAGGWAPDALLAEHGLSMLLTVRKGERTHRFLFDAAATPDGVAENMRRMGSIPARLRPSYAAMATSIMSPASMA